MPRPARRFIALLGVALVVAPAIHAEDSPDTARLREALRQASAKLNETEAQLEQQQLATAAAERERDALKQAQPAAAKDDARSAALQRKLASSAGELAQARADGEKFQAAQQAADQAAQKKETERAALAQQLVQLRARMDRCAASDEAMYGTGLEIAGLYRDPGFVDHLRNLHLKPFGFDRVREENRMRELEDRLAEQHAAIQHCHADATPAAATSTLPPASPAQAEPGSEGHP
ncbi:MAG TPA: hypothetical protein VGH80_11010 [Xanthomonadaceae bacterium]|jgi:multidrug efflux pump subunit AcrA (membrane-fusion protein)